MIWCGRSMKKRCPQSSDGMHKPDVKIRQGIVNKEVTVRCKYCNKRMERYKAK